MKRFYKSVSIAGEGDGFAVQLDARPVKTPHGARLVLPTPALADAVAQEWRDQQDTIDPQTMPLTKAANTTIDGVTPRREEVIEELLKYGGGDLLCYRAEDDKLAERQRLAWDPVLDWLAERHGARLAITQGITHIAQPGEAIIALGRALKPFSPYILTALSNATSLTGSLTLALAIQDAHLTAVEAFEKAHLDEQYQAERWGQDAEAEERRVTLRQELESSAKFMALARV